MNEDPVLRAVKLSLLGQEESNSLHEDIKNILSFVEEVRSINTESAEQEEEAENEFRDDEVTVRPGTFRDVMLDRAPVRHGNWFVSKKIL